MTYAVETQNLTKQYKTTLAVNQVNIQVPEGCCCGFLGKNGAGKTTTIKMLVGLIKPTSGNMYMMGQQQHFGQQNAAMFGYLPDVPNFYGYMTGQEFLELCAHVCGIKKPEAATRIKSLLALVGLGKSRTPISGYSRGMKQRLGIAQAMINNPKVIFMDEPMSALDPMGRKDVAEIIQSLKGTTVIFSTHILADVESVCDYILIIEKGKMLAQETMEGLRRRHADNTLMLRFDTDAAATSFAEKATAAGLAVSPEGRALQLTAQAGGQAALTHTAMGIIYQHNLPLEHFAAHSPSLEEIFYKEIAHAK